MDRKSLKPSTVICQLSDPVNAQIHYSFANCIMASVKVIGSIFFATDELFMVEQLVIVLTSSITIGFGSKNNTRDVFSGFCFPEKSVESIISASNCFVIWDFSIELNAMYKAIEFPTGITSLDTSLTKWIEMHSLIVGGKKKRKEKIDSRAKGIGKMPKTYTKAPGARKR